MSPLLCITLTLLAWLSPGCAEDDITTPSIITNDGLSPTPSLGPQTETTPQRVNPCDSGPCQNGGSCTAANVTHFICSCPTAFTGTLCERAVATCSLSAHSRLVTFAGEESSISVPCAYTLAQLQCGNYTVRVDGTSEIRCLNKRRQCRKNKRANFIISLNINIESRNVSYTGKIVVDGKNLSLTTQTTGDGAVIAVMVNAKAVTVRTADRVFSLSHSLNDGVIISCVGAPLQSPAYPMSLCGAVDGFGAIGNRTRDLRLTALYQTVALDIVANSSLPQPETCQEIASRVQQCDDPDAVIARCKRCFNNRHERTDIPCLISCLRKRGGCE